MLVESEQNQTEHTYRVGVFLDSADSYFNRRVIKDLVALADERKLKLVFFFGGSLDKGLQTGPGSFCYSLPDTEYIDALIVFPNVLSPYNPVSGTSGIIEKLPGIPVYSFFVTHPQFFSVVVDETEAIDQLISHLVKHHSFRHFSILSGPQSGESLSCTRQKQIEAALSKHSLTIAKEDSFTGTFTIEDGKETARTILFSGKKAPDVLICLNDQMAIGAMNEFIHNGLSVPDDIAIIGFDDVEENASLKCSLTTLNFPIWTMCTVIIDKIANDLFQRTPYTKEVVTFPAELIIRRSCGCSEWFEVLPKKKSSFSPISEKRQSNSSLKQSVSYKHAMQHTLEKSLESQNYSSFSTYIVNTISLLSQSGQLTNSFIDDLANEWTLALANHPLISEQTIINSLFIDAFKNLLLEKASLFSRQQTTNNGSLEFYRECNEIIARKLSVLDSLKGLGAQLPHLSISELFIVMIAPDRTDTGEIRLEYKDSEYIRVPEKNFTRVLLKKLIPSFLAHTLQPIALMPISRKGNVFGYTAVVLKDNNIAQLSLIQEMISLIISAAADNLVLSDHIEALLQKNQHLSQLSLIDDFTGLYNRRALYKTGRAMFESAQDKRESSCFIFIDMDGLKKINDTFGHNAGDTAIKILADILKHSFRENDLVVRYGGDEFVVVMINITEIVLEKTLSRIANRIVAFNEQEQYKWLLSVSWGVVFNKKTTYEKSFEAVIEESDAKLYREKHKKKNMYGFSKLS